MSIVSLGGKIAPALLVPDQNNYIQLLEGTGADIILTPYPPTFDVAPAVGVGAAHKTSKDGTAQHDLQPPASYNVGDILFVYAFGQSSITAPVNAGAWTELTLNGGTNRRFWYRVATGDANDVHTVAQQLVANDQTGVWQMCSLNTGWTPQRANEGVFQSGVTNPSLELPYDDVAVGGDTVDTLVFALGGTLLGDSGGTFPQPPTVSPPDSLNEVDFTVNDLDSGGGPGSRRRCVHMWAYELQAVSVDEGTDHWTQTPEQNWAAGSCTRFTSAYRLKSI